MPGTSIIAQRAYQSLLMDKRPELLAGLSSQGQPWTVPHIYTSLWASSETDPFIAVVGQSEVLESRGVNMVAGEGQQGVFPLTVYLSIHALREYGDLETFERQLIQLHILAARIALLVRATAYVEYTGFRFGLGDNTAVTGTDESTFIPATEYDPDFILLAIALHFTCIAPVFDPAIVWDSTFIETLLS